MRISYGNTTMRITDFVCLTECSGIWLGIHYSKLAKKWNAHLKSTRIAEIDGSHLHSFTCDGDTPEEALASLAKLISKKTLVNGSYTILIPELTQ